MNASIDSPASAFGSARFAQLVAGTIDRIGALAAMIAPPVLRLALAVPFFKSGLTRWDGFLQLSPSTIYMFQNMFQLHVLGGQYPIPAPVIVAHLVAVAEISLPVLLVLGLATRFAALALLIMTGIIQLVDPTGWANFHLPWASIALAIMALGAGPLSLDAIVRRVMTYAPQRHD